MAFNDRLQYSIDATDSSQGAWRSFYGGIDRAQGSVSRLSRALGALGFGAAIAGAGRMAKQMLDQADAFGKAADRAGLHTDTLQELGYAGQFFDVTQERINNGLVTFAKRLGEARQGAGPLHSFLRKYNEELADMVARAPDTDAALDLIFQAMGSAEDQADRAAIAAAAFSKSAGTEMAILLKDGYDALQVYRERAHEVNVVFSEEGVRSAEMLNDAWTGLWTELKGYAIPVFERLLFLFRDLFGLEITDPVLRAKVAVRELSEELAELNESIDYNIEQGIPHAELLILRRDKIEELAAATRDLVAAEQGETAALEVRVERGSVFARTTEEETASIEKRNEATRRGTVAIDEQSRSLEEVGRVGANVFSGLLTSTDGWRDSLMRAGEQLLSLAFSEGWEALMSQVFNMSGGGMNSANKGGGGAGGFLSSIFSGISLFSGGGFFGLFNDGGRFTVPGGVGGGDRQLVSFGARAGEEIEITPAGRARRGEAAGQMVYMDFRGAGPGVAQEVDRVLARRLPGIRRQSVEDSVAAVERLANVGGSFSKSIGRRR